MASSLMLGQVAQAGSEEVPASELPAQWQAVNASRGPNPFDEDDAIDSDEEENLAAALTLTSYVPLPVIRYYAHLGQPLQHPVKEYFPGTVLFADISGFTPLADRLSKQENGVALLTNVINSLFDPFIAIVNEYGGDVIKFAGDALVVCFPVYTTNLHQHSTASDDATRLAESVVAATECGLQLNEFIDSSSSHTGNTGDVSTGGGFTSRLRSRLAKRHHRNSIGSLAKNQGRSLYELYRNYRRKNHPTKGATSRHALAAEARSDSLQTQQTNVLAQFKLRMKVSIGAGSLLGMHVGGVGGRWEYFIMGSPMDQVTAAEGVAKPGYVVVHRTAWDLLRSVSMHKGIQATDISGCEHVRVTSFTRPVLASGFRHASTRSPAFHGVKDYIKRMRQLRMWCLDQIASRPLMTRLFEGYMQQVVVDRIKSLQTEWMGEMRKLTVLFVLLPGIVDGKIARVAEQQHAFGTPTHDGSTPRTPTEAAAGFGAGVGAGAGVDASTASAGSPARSVSESHTPVASPVNPRLSSTNPSIYSAHAKLPPLMAEDISALHSPSPPSAHAGRPFATPSSLPGVPNSASGSPADWESPRPLHNRQRSLSEGTDPSSPCRPVHGLEPSEVGAVPILDSSTAESIAAGPTADLATFNCAGIQLTVSVIMDVLRRFEGTLRQFIVDDKGCVLIAAFGVPPKAHEDDDRRGVAAAVDIYRELQACDTECSIGVASGHVFCGNVGSRSRREYAMVGDAVNLSARLMGAARKAAVAARKRMKLAQENNNSGSVRLTPMMKHMSEVSILVDERTHSMAQKFLKFHALDPIKVKGKPTPMAVYTPVLAGVGVRRQSMGRASQVGAEESERGNLLVGRAAELHSLRKELSLLEECVQNRWEQVERLLPIAVRELAENNLETGTEVDEGEARQLARPAPGFANQESGITKEAAGFLRRSLSSDALIGVDSFGSPTLAKSAAAPRNPTVFPIAERTDKLSPVSADAANEAMNQSALMHSSSRHLQDLLGQVNDRSLNMSALAPALDAADAAANTAANTAANAAGSVAGTSVASARMQSVTELASLRRTWSVVDSNKRLRSKLLPTDRVRRVISMRLNHLIEPGDMPAVPASPAHSQAAVGGLPPQQEGDSKQDARPHKQLVHGASWKSVMTASTDDADSNAPNRVAAPTFPWIDTQTNARASTHGFVSMASLASQVQTPGHVDTTGASLVGLVAPSTATVNQSSTSPLAAGVGLDTGAGAGAGAGIGIGSPASPGISARGSHNTSYSSVTGQSVASDVVQMDGGGSVETGAHTRLTVMVSSNNLMPPTPNANQGALPRLNSSTSMGSYGAGSEALQLGVGNSRMYNQLNRFGSRLGSSRILGPAQRRPRGLMTPAHGHRRQHSAQPMFQQQGWLRSGSVMAGSMSFSATAAVIASSKRLASNLTRGTTFNDDRSGRSLHSRDTLTFGSDSTLGRAPPETVTRRHNLMLITGLPGMGRSSLMVEAWRAAKTEHPELLVAKGSADSFCSIPYRCWRQVFATLLSALRIDASSSEAHEGLTSLCLELGLTNYIISLLPLLNDLIAFHPALPETPLTKGMTSISRADNLRLLLVSLLTRLAVGHGRRAPQGLVFFIKDADHMDGASLELFLSLTKVPNILMVVSVRTMDELTRKHADMQAVFDDAATGSVNCGPLSQEQVEALICQSMGTQTVDPAITEAVYQRALGAPLFVVQLCEVLKHMHLVSCKGTRCRLAGGATSLDMNVLPDSMHTYVAATLDKLSPADQLVLKICSVCGTFLSARMLQDVHPENTPGGAALSECHFVITAEEIQASLKRLTQAHLLQPVHRDAVPYTEPVVVVSKQRSRDLELGADIFRRRQLALGLATVETRIHRRGTSTATGMSRRSSASSMANSISSTGSAETYVTDDHKEGEEEEGIGEFFEFISLSVQELVYSSLPYTQTQKLHSMIGAWFEQPLYRTGDADDAIQTFVSRVYTERQQRNETTTMTPEDNEDDDEAVGDLVPVLAHHWGRSTVASRAQLYLQHAARLALSRTSIGEAIRWMKILVGKGGNPVFATLALTPIEMASWHRALGEAYLDSGSARRAESHLLDACALLKLHIPTGAAVKVKMYNYGHRAKASLCSCCLGGRERNEEKLAWLDQASLTLQSMVQVAQLLDNTQLQEYCLRKALSFAQRRGPSTCLANVYTQVALFSPLLNLSRVKALDYCREAAALACTLDDTALELKVQTVACRFYMQTAAWKEAVDGHAHASQLAESIGNAREWEEIVNQLSWLTVLEGHTTEAVNLYKLCLHSAHSRNDMEMYSVALMGMASCHIRGGFLDIAYAELQEVMARGSLLTAQDVVRFNGLCVAALRGLEHHSSARRLSVESAGLILSMGLQPDSFACVEGYYETADQLLWILENWSTPVPDTQQSSRRGSHVGPMQAPTRQASRAYGRGMSMMTTDSMSGINSSLGALAGSSRIEPAAPQLGMRASQALRNMPSTAGPPMQLPVGTPPAAAAASNRAAVGSARPVLGRSGSFSSRANTPYARAKSRGWAPKSPTSNLQSLQEELHASHEDLVAATEGVLAALTYLGGLYVAVQPLTRALHARLRLALDVSTSKSVLKELQSALKQAKKIQLAPLTEQVASTFEAVLLGSTRPHCSLADTDFTNSILHTDHTMGSTSFGPSHGLGMMSMPGISTADARFAGGAFDVGSVPGGARTPVVQVNSLGPDSRRLAAAAAGVGSSDSAGLPTLTTPNVAALAAQHALSVPHTAPPVAAIERHQSSMTDDDSRRLDHGSSTVLEGSARLEHASSRMEAAANANAALDQVDESQETTT